MRRTSFTDFHCSLARAVEVMGDWWTPLIVRDLYLGLDRFDDLVTNLGISRNLLTDRLGDLVVNGLVARETYLRRPVRYRYQLTEKGADLVPVIVALTAWGDRWESPAGGPPVTFRHGRHACIPTVACDRCREPLSTRNLQVRPGPGGREDRGTMLIGSRLPKVP